MSRGGARPGTGGARPGSGPKPSWNLGKTKAIRVPEVLADMLVRIAREIDDTSSPDEILKDEEVQRHLEKISEIILQKLIAAFVKELE